MNDAVSLPARFQCKGLSASRAATIVRLDRAYQIRRKQPVYVFRRNRDEVEDCVGY